MSRPLRAKRSGLITSTERRRSLHRKDQQPASAAHRFPKSFALGVKNGPCHHRPSSLSRHFVIQEPLSFFDLISQFFELLGRTVFLGESENFPFLAFDVEI